MCNCGKKRNEYTQQPSALVSSIAASVHDRNRNFKYTGNTALTVKGSITGKNYRFSYPGDVQNVDYRDAIGMMSVSILKEVNSKY